jgi:uncharacterized membrane protein
LTEPKAEALALRWAEAEPLQAKARSKGGGVGARMKRVEAKPRKRAAGREKQGTKAADAKWQGKGFTPPSLVIYRFGGTTLPTRARRAH